LEKKLAKLEREKQNLQKQLNNRPTPPSPPHQPKRINKKTLLAGGAGLAAG